MFSRLWFWRHDPPKNMKTPTNPDDTTIWLCHRVNSYYPEFFFI